MLENNFKLHPNEKVLLVIRKHIIFLVWDIVSVAFLFLIPSILIWVAQYLNFIPDFK